MTFYNFNKVFISGLFYQYRLDCDFIHCVPKKTKPDNF